jgi:DEAD/DEAH box helicase domain-containing protein
MSLLPSFVREPGAGFAPVMSRTHGPVCVVGWWPLMLAKNLPAPDDWSAPAVVLMDASAAEDEEALHRAWRRWLQVFNTLQFLRGTLLVTSDGLAGHDYEGCVPAGPTTPAAQPAAAAALGAAWQAVLDQTLEALAPGLKQLAQAGAALPGVGLELTDAKGRVTADAELAWLDEKVVILRTDQVDLAEAWRAAQWTVLLLDEAMNRVDGVAWSTVVAARLGLDINVNEGGAA